MMLPISLPRPPPPMRPDSVPDLGAIQIIYLLTYLLTLIEALPLVTDDNSSFTRV